MSVSLYYAARRSRALSDDERAAVARIVAEANLAPTLDAAAEEQLAHWEGLSLRPDASRGDDLLVGASQLPSSPELAVEVVEHLCAALSELRRALPGASWNVHIDDVDVPWNEELERFDPCPAERSDCA